MKASLAEWGTFPSLTMDGLVGMGFGNWNGRLALIPKAWFCDLPAGLVLTCIDGSSTIVGEDYIDQDTRSGFLAYGIEGEEGL